MICAAVLLSIVYVCFNASVRFLCEFVRAVVWLGLLCGVVCSCGFVCVCACVCLIACFM